MSEIDGLSLGVGIMLAITSLGAVIRPDLLVKDSRRNRNCRLREIDAGAPERYFEERRELEAYAPRFDLSHRALRLWGSVGFILGLVVIYLAF